MSAEYEAKKVYCACVRRRNVPTRDNVDLGLSYQTNQNGRMFSATHEKSAAMRRADILRRGKGTVELKQTSQVARVNYLGRLEGQSGGSGTRLVNKF